MRVAFASLGSLGDLHPLLSVARAAEKRGHDVVIAASKGFRDYVTSLDLKFFPIRPDLEPAVSQVRRLSDPGRGPERLLREEVFPAVRETYADLAEACRETDLLVVGELLYVAPLVAAKCRIPWVNAVLAPSSFLSALDPCVLAPAPGFHHLRHLGTLPHRLLLAFGNRLTSRWAEPLFAFRRELGFSPGKNPVFEGKHSPLLTLALFPDFFAAPQNDWPPQVRQTGFPYFEQEAGEESRGALRAFLEAGAPPLVFTLGSSMVQIADDFYGLAARAADALGRRAILLLGKNPPPPRLPETMLGLAYAPLESVFPHAAAVVHHGGIGSCAMTLRSGVPALVIPFAYDQPDNAERLRKLGVALTLARKGISSGSLAGKLRRILQDRGMQDRARAIAGQITPDDDMESTIDALEEAARAI
ncbi:MAG: glycosyltransferase [Terrimicrobiaceae bacterium]|jgi:UDP:flavonoid glycosyltransferase YjiC (YdhE family)